MPKSDAENALFFSLKADGLPLPEREFRFHPVRRWRFDFAWPDYMLAVEVEGVTKWGGKKKIGGHQTAEGYRKNCEKYNAATLLGWWLLRYTQDQISLAAADIEQKLITLGWKP